jgi:hypothetical protein
VTIRTNGRVLPARLYPKDHAQRDMAPAPPRRGETRLALAIGLLNGPSAPSNPSGSASTE